MSRIDRPAFRPEIFDETIRGLEAGLKVGDVATLNFVSCEADATVDSVLTSAAFALFDAIPVREAGRVVGVLERSEGIRMDDHVGSSMRPLDDSMLVSADNPLKTFIPLLVSTPYRLVVDDARIVAIVTRSDVHKLPVRLLIFALVTHLELLMAEIVTRAEPNDQWIESLGPRRRERFDAKRRELRTANFDPPLIELTDFCDKRDLLLPLVTADIDIGKNKAKSELERIEELRNQVAHAAGFAGDQEEFKRFVCTFESAETWINRLNAVLAE